VDEVVTRRADHQGLASSFGHELHPRGLWPPLVVEVGELADLVHVHGGPFVAELAPARPEPMDQLLPFAAGGGGQRPVVDDRSLLLPQGNAAKACDQWLPALSFDAGFEAPARPVRRVDGGLVLAGLWDADMQFDC
jgi:hypothetical protein